MLSKENPKLNIPFRNRTREPENAGPILDWSRAYRRINMVYPLPSVSDSSIEEIRSDFQTRPRPETKDDGSDMDDDREPIPLPLFAPGYSEKVVNAKFSACRPKGDIVEMRFDDGKSISMSVQGSAAPRFVIYPASMELGQRKVNDVPGLASAIAESCRGKSISSISSGIAPSGGAVLIVRSRNGDEEPIILVVQGNAHISFRSDAIPAFNLFQA